MKRKSKRRTTAARGAADIVSRFKVFAEKEAAASFRRAQRAGNSRSEVAFYNGVSHGLSYAFRWISEWDTRASKKPGGLGRNPSGGKKR